MNNIYSIENSSTNFSYHYYSDITQVPSCCEEAVQNSFEQSLVMNDIDVTEDLSYKHYLKNCPIILIFKKDLMVGFVIFNYLTSIKALDYNVYINSDQSVYMLKSICREVILIYLHIAKDIYIFEMFYFNVSHKVVFSWAKESLKTGDCVKIRDNYYVCYGYLDKQYIENIILKGINILVKNN